MGKIPMSILLVVTLVATGKVQATTVEFYDDALIQEGDDYFYVSVHDTEPFHTTLYMFGGFVHDLSIHDSSTFNFFGGTLDTLILVDSSTANLYGGTINLSLEAYFSSTLNIYGYGFDLTEIPAGHTLSGYWGDGSEFSMYLRASTYERAILHVIPEPASFSFLGLSVLILRIRNRHQNSRRYRNVS